MSKPIVFMMIGVQASGKSTLAKILATERSAVILSADTYREKNPSWDNSAVFKALYSDLRELLDKNQNVILDNTNTTVKMRSKAFEILKDYNCSIKGVVLLVPYEVCKDRLLARNALGGRQVSVEVLNRYYKSFQTPSWEEPFEELQWEGSFMGVIG